MDDADIAEAVRQDPDAAPIADEAFWSRAKIVMPMPKQAISIRLDTDVLDFFKDAGPGYQSRINAVLRSYVDTVMRTRRALIEGEESGIDRKTSEDIRKAVRDALGRA
ncbi:MAG: BrnA antitoxin family protein [Rhodospirillales bacterium]|tara:strand:- start:1249 stop:1572 length:324 start_codon:yes stop_codon:yes gene_type:complete